MQNPRRRSRRPLTPVAVTSTLALTATLVPGAAFAVVADGLVPIAAVQGTGETSPLAGQTVTVEGVITADHRGEDGYGGVYVQTAGTGGAVDATPGASDGVFVLLEDEDPATPTPATGAIGDAVSVTGVVEESDGLTRIDASGADASIISLGGEGVERPVATDLPASVVGAAREQYEGMLVTPTGEYRVASLHQVSAFGTVWLSAGEEPLVKATEVAEPGSAAAAAIAGSNAARRLLLDDGRSVRGSATEQPYEIPGVRTGDGIEFRDLWYVLDVGFGEWRLQPLLPLDGTTGAADLPAFEVLNLRPEAPDAVGGDLSLGAFNVLNYFTTLTGQDPDARGARSAEQLAIQRAKIVRAINALDADVVALMEIENSIHFGDGTPDVALADLVAGLDAAAGAGTWDYVRTPAALTGPGATATTDVIMNAIIYRTAAVTPVGAATTDVDETVWGNAREPIAQTFRPAGGGGAFTVVANHFKSKSGDGEEPADGQGLFNADRVAQAGAVADLVAELRASSGSPDVAVLGDLNAYSQEDPVEVLTDAGLVDVVAVEAPGQYTYTFDGELGSLDHALLTASFAERVTGADVWEINAPEWNALEYFGPFADARTVFRSSDHDPLVVGFTAAPAPSTVEVDVLAINDFHGRIERPGVDPGEPIEPSPAEVLDEAVRSFRAANPDTVFVSAGDNIGASTFTSFVQRDEPTIDVLDAIGLQASAVGNHEFDRGFADLAGRVTDRAEFPYLGANVYLETGAPALEQYALVRADGVTVGFIGAVTEDLPTLVTPSGIEDLEVRDVVTEVNRVATQLSDGQAANGEADVLVLLVHEGAESEDVADLAPGTTFGDIATGTSPEVHAIVSGHTHQRYNHRLPVPGWPAGLTRPVMQAAEYGEALDHLTFTVDAGTGAVVGIDSKVVDLTAEAFPDTDPAATSAVERLVLDAAAEAEELGARSLGEITADLDRARTAAGEENRGGESTLGNLVADVQLWATERLGTQIAFMNPGGLRADLAYESTGQGDPDGNVTYREAANVQPFANTLVAMDLTGEQVVQVLEEQWQPVTATRPFLKLGVSAGLSYTYDPTASAGERITSVLLDGEPVVALRTYRVVVNSFLASGGDNFATLAEGGNRQDSGQVDLEAFVDYMELSSPVTPDLVQRSVGVHVVDEPADGTWAPGDTVTIALSSLLFSAGEEQGSTVSVALDGQPVGTFPVDPAVVDTTDEVGRATVTVTIPAGAVDGRLDVVATVAGTGTTVTVPLTVDAAAPVAQPVPDRPTTRPVTGGALPVTPARPVRPRGPLAVTGAEAAALGGLAAALLGGGACLYLVSRRRTAPGDPS